MGHSLAASLPNCSLIKLRRGGRGNRFRATQGILVLPLSTYLALTPIFSATEHVQEDFHLHLQEMVQGLCNTLSESEARDEFERRSDSCSRSRDLAGSPFERNAHSIATINFRNNARAPLLFIGGEKDVLMPAALNRKNSEKYAASSAITEYKEFPGRSHYIIAEKRLEEVANTPSIGR